MADPVTDQDLLWALRVLVKESVGDFVYTMRERVLGDPDFRGNSWDHPRVKAWSDASRIIEDYVKEHPESEESE